MKATAFDLYSEDGGSQIRSAGDEITSVRRVGRLDKQDLLSFEVLEGPQVRDYQPRRLLRIQYESEPTEWWRVKRKTHSRGRSPRLQYKCEPRWLDLDESVAQIELADGTKLPSVTVTRLAVEDALSRILSSDLNAPAGFQAGSVAADLQGEEVSVWGEAVSHLKLLNDLVGQLGAKWTATWNETAGAYDIDVVERVGNSDASKRTITDKTADPSVKQVTDEQDTGDFFSRLVPIGGQRGQRQTIAGARWTVESANHDSGANETTLTVDGAVEWRADALEGRQVLDQTGSTYSIVGSAAPSTLVVSGDASGVSTVQIIEGDGSDVVALEAPSAISSLGEVTRRKTFDVTPYANLLERAGVDASGSSLTGWAAIGSASLSLSTTGADVRHGDAAVQVEGDKDDGVQTAACSFSPQEDGPTLSAWVSLRVLSGEARVELVDQNGDVYPPDGQLNASGATLRGFKIGGEQPAAGNVRLRVTCLESGTDLRIDAATLVASAAPVQYSGSMGPSKLWEEGVRFMQKNGGDRTRQITGEVFDLEELSGIGEPFRVGDAVTVDLRDTPVMEARLQQVTRRLDVGHAAPAMSAETTTQRKKAEMLEEERPTPQPPDAGQSARIEPKVSVDVRDEGETGYVEVTVEDRSNVVEAVELRKKAGGNIDKEDQSWSSMTFSDGVYVGSVALKEKHPSQLQWRVMDTEGNVVASQLHTLDFDDIPQGNYTLTFRKDASAGGTIVEVLCRGDEDTASFTSEFTGPDGGSETVTANGRQAIIDANSSYPLESGETFDLILTAYGSQDGNGKKEKEPLEKTDVQTPYLAEDASADALEPGDGVNINDETNVVSVDDSVARTAETQLLASRLVQTETEIDALDAVTVRKSRQLGDGVNTTARGVLGDGASVDLVPQPSVDQVTLAEQADVPDESVRADRSLTGGEGIQQIGDLTQDREVAVDSTVARTDRDETFDEDVTVIGDFFVEGEETVLNTETVEASDNLIFLNAGQQGAGITSGFAGFEADRGTEEPVKLVFEEVTDLGRVGIHYKTLNYSGLSGSFDLHEEVEGQSSGATGIVWNDDGSTLSLKGRTGSFSDGETINGQSSGASATVDSTTQVDDTQALATREDSPSTGGIPFFNSNGRLFETTEDLKLVGGQSNDFYNGEEVQIDTGLGHSGYVAELSHWYITPGGLGDFRTLLADELRVEAFIAEVEEALAGSDFLTKSFATLDQPFEVPSSNPVGAQKDLTVQDLDGLGALAVFNNETRKEDDTLRLRIVDRSDGGLTVADIWLRAIAGSYTDNGDGTQTWTIEILEAGDQGIGAGLTAPEGSIVLDYGVPGDFLIERSVLNPDSGDIAPYDRMLQWTDPDGNRIPDPSDFEVLNLRGRLDGLPKARATGFGVYSETARFTQDVAVGDLEAADAGDESGSYLKFTKSGGLKVVTQGGDVESRTAQNESDLRLLARRVAQERESRAGIELNVGQNAAEIELNAEVIGDGSRFSKSTLSLQVSQNEDDISANNTAIANLEATVGDGTGFSEADLTLQAGKNEDDISANSTAVADLEAIVGDGQNLAEADLTLTASQNTDDISSNDSAIADLSAVVGDDSKFSESTLSLQASQNEDDASSNASAIADLEATVGDDSKFSESTLSLQASQNEADLKLLARRVTQESESRAGLELNVGDNAATIQLHTEVLNQNGLGASTDITSRVSTAEDDIGINASDISANATDIADNVDAINLNAGDIDSNATAINSLEAQVGDGSISAGADLTQAANANTGDISDNEGNISQNATAITDLENYVGIDETLAAESNLTLLANANKSDTDQNASDISANATDIADNSDAINLNADDIDSNATAITDIENHVGIDENLAAEANLTLLANANKSDTDENATAITQLENRVGVGETLEVESNLTLAANQNAADIKLVARRVVQQQEATAGIEANVNENSATLLAEVTFEPAGSAKDSSRAAMKLVADDDGSSAALIGDSIELTGDTFVDGTFTVDDGTAGGWTVNQTDIRSKPTQSNAGLLLSTDLGMGRFQDSGASLRATSDVTDSTAGPLVELFVEDANNFGLYAEDGGGNAVLGLGANPAGSNRPGDFFVDGSLVIDGTITAGEIDVPDFWATDATVENSLTMGSNGKITNANDDYRIDQDGFWVQQGGSNFSSEVAYEFGGVGDTRLWKTDQQDLRIENTDGLIELAAPGGTGYAFDVTDNQLWLYSTRSSEPSDSQASGGRLYVLDTGSQIKLMFKANQGASNEDELAAISY